MKSKSLFDDIIVFLLILIAQVLLITYLCIYHPDSSTVPTLLRVGIYLVDFASGWQLGNIIWKAVSRANTVEAGE